MTRTSRETYHGDSMFGVCTLLMSAALGAPPTEESTPAPGEDTSRARILLHEGEILILTLEGHVKHAALRGNLGTNSASALGAEENHGEPRSSWTDAN
jgi:hypothetical protein